MGMTVAPASSPGSCQPAGRCREGIMDGLSCESATRHTSHAHDMVHTNAGTPARILSHSTGSPARTRAGVRACEQTLTALPACGMHCKAWQRPRYVDVWVRCVRDGCYVYHTRPAPGSVRGNGQIVLFCLPRPYTTQTLHIPSIASARPSSQPAALCSQSSLSPLLGACPHHPAVSATASSPRTTRAV